MFKSIVEDIKGQFATGHMITKLIIINVGIWAFMALIKAFTPGSSSFYEILVSYLAIPGEPIKLLLRPWTIITHMFVHDGFGHVLWNMIYLYFFGRIVGEMIGDRHILPVYFASGLFGALAYFTWYQIMPVSIGAYAVGSSAAVSGLVLASGLIAPDYEINFFGFFRIRLKFIVLAVLLFYIIGLRSANQGGHVAHLAGMVMGFIFFRQLGGNKDISYRFNTFFDWITSLFDGSQREKARSKQHLKVKFKSDKLAKNETVSISTEEQVDLILDKIKKSGFKSLTTEERDILAKASKE